MIFKKTNLKHMARIKIITLKKDLYSFNNRLKIFFKICI